MEQSLRTRYQNAFDKINSWIKENVPSNIEIRTNGVHDVYVRNEISIINSMLSLFKGSWGWGNDITVKGHSLKYYSNNYSISSDGNIVEGYWKRSNPYSQGEYDGMIKDFVDTWKTHYKPIIEKEISKYNSLDDFEA